MGDGNSTEGGFAAQKTQTSYFGGLKYVFLTLQLELPSEAGPWLRPRQGEVS